MPNTVITLTLDVELTEREKQDVENIFHDAFGEFLTHRNVRVTRAGIADDAEYYADHGADLYVQKRYPTFSEKFLRDKADQVRRRSRIAAIIKQAAFDALEVK